jgi:hypothetical protein
MIEIEGTVKLSDPCPPEPDGELEKAIDGRHAPTTEAERQLALARRIARDNEEALAALAR